MRADSPATRRRARGPRTPVSEDAVHRARRTLAALDLFLAPAWLATEFSRRFDVAGAPANSGPAMLAIRICRLVFAALSGHAVAPGRPFAYAAVHRTWLGVAWALLH